MSLPCPMAVAVDSVILTGWRMICAAAPLALALGTVAVDARAQSRDEPTLADKETARQAFYEGQDAFNAGDLKGALKAFRAADAIMGVPSTRIEVGRTLKQMGRLLEAAEKLASVDLIPADDDENEVQQDARAEARTLLEEVRVRIPTLQIAIRGVAPSTAVELVIDGDAIPAGAQDYPRKVDPGRHVIRVAAAGYRQVTEEVTVDEREEKTVKISLVASSDGDPPVGPDPAPEEAQDGGFEIPVWGWVGFGVGAAGFIVGGITGGLTLANVSELEDDCGGKVCPTRDQARIDDATTVAHVSTAGFVVGGVGVGVGVAALVVALTADETPTRGLSVRPWVGPGSAGLHGRF